MTLKNRIMQKKAAIGVIGLGYVGLPLAVEFGKAGFHVVGVDLDEEKIKEINKGGSYIPDIGNKNIKKLIDEQRLIATSNYEVLKDLDAVIICVPTPLTKTKEPNLSHVISASNEIAKHLRKDQLIVLESTTYPGTTEEVVLPILESTCLTVGKDIYLAYSPERIDPGNKKYSIKEIPKVIGGVTEKCAEVASALYGQIIEKIVLVSSLKAAEMTKLLENIFRNVNIALVNELAMLCDRMGISVWEVIEAASTKPYGFMPFYPGPGVGGHCIPIDPFYLSWKAKEHDFRTRFIELAGEVNENMPYYIVQKIADVLNNAQKSIKSSNILVLGVAYKKDINDVRMSPALKLIELLQEKGANVFYNDPYVPIINISGNTLKSVPLEKHLLDKIDCVVITTDHSCYDYKWMFENSKLILDTKNAMKGKSEKVVKL